MKAPGIGMSLRERERERARERQRVLSILFRPLKPFPFRRASHCRRGEGNQKPDHRKTV